MEFEEIEVVKMTEGKEPEGPHRATLVGTLDGKRYIIQTETKITSMIEVDELDAF